MIKDVFVLKKTAYHCKMMKYIWNINYYDFSHMCPYFWLTIFNHFLFPPLFIIKEGGRLIGKTTANIFEFLGDWAESYESKRLTNWIEKLMENPEQKVSDLTKLKNKNYDKYCNVLWEMRKKDPSKELLFQQLIKQINEDANKKRIQKIKQEQKELKEKQETLTLYYQSEEYKLLEEKRRKKEEREAKRTLTNKQLIVKLNKILKPILTMCAYILGAIVVSGVLYGIYQLGIFLFFKVKHKTYIDLLEVLKYGTFILIGLALITFICYSITTLFKKIDMPIINIKTPMFLKRIGKFFFIIGKYIKSFFKWIGNAAQLVKQMFANQCPAIKWED